MPLSDMFSDGLVQPTLNWAKQNNLGSALGTMALAIPIAMAAQSLSKRRDRAGAAGGVYRMFGNLAFDQMQRPQRTRDALTLQQIQKGDMTLTPPSAGATPAGDMYGQPYYQAQTLAEQHPEYFATTETPARTAPPEWHAPMEWPTTKTGPSPSLQLAGKMPGTPEAIRALIGILAKKETTQDAAAQQQQGFQQFQEQVAGNPDLETSYGYGKGGLSMKASPPKADSVSQASLAKEQFGKDPVKMEKYLMGKQGGPPKRTMKNIPVTDKQGNQLTMPVWDNGDGTTSPVDIPGAGGKRFNSKPDTRAAEMQANNQLNVINSEIRMLQQQLTKTGLPSKKAKIEQRLEELKGEQATVIQTFQNITGGAATFPTGNIEQDAQQTLQGLFQ